MASPEPPASAPDATSVCADGDTDEPDPVDEPVEVSADSARSEPDIDDPSADEPASTAAFFADNGESDSASEDLSGEFLAPPAGEPAPTADFLANDDGESEYASLDLPGEFPCCEPPADEPSAEASAVASFDVDALVPPVPDAEPGDDSDELDPRESVLDSSAHTTPGVVTTAVPIPNATANAPTRPTYLAYPTVVPPHKRRTERSKSAIDQHLLPISQLSEAALTQEKMRA
jgi:hypothetical protein